MNIIEILRCKYCNEIYNDPVTLNCCGGNICQKHIDELLSQSSACPLCNSDIPNQNSKINKTLKDLVDEVELHKLKIDKMSAYKELLKSFEEKIESIELMNKEPDHFINNKFSELRRLVDLDREKAKTEIDTLADDMINELDSCEKELKSDCKSNPNAEYYTSLIKDMRSRSDDYEKFLKSLRHSIKDREKKSADVKQLVLNLDLEIEEFGNKLLKNKVIRYEPMRDEINNIFGQLCHENIHRVTCYVCGVKDFSGTRYGCLICRNCDLCEDCFRSRKVSLDHKLEHPMVPYGKPDQIFDLNMADVKDISLAGFVDVFKNHVHVLSICNACKRYPITGLKFRCDTCVVGDFCFGCFESRKITSHKHQVFVIKN
jgi:hypothetical protein